MTQESPDSSPHASRRVALRAGIRAVLLLGSVTALFLLLPVSGLNMQRTLLVTVVFLVGVAGAAALIVWQVMNYRRASLSGRARAQGLLVALYVAVLFFALTYYVLATAYPQEIAGLSTRLDALYFSLTIVSTVGFGDIYGAGQAARAIVSLQIAFNFLFVSLAVAAARAGVR